MSERRLLGFHDKDVRDMYADMFRLRGFEVDEASNLDAMLQHIYEGQYELYLMDSNLGSFGDDPEPLIKVYATLQVKDYLRSARLIGITSHVPAVAALKKLVSERQYMNVEIYDKMDFQSKLGTI